MLFCPLKILLNSAILQYKKNRQEFRRIFKERKSIVNVSKLKSACNDELIYFV